MNKQKPTIIVAGMARCGSSLTMQMLDAAGLRCAGRYPAFEPDEVKLSRGGPKAQWMRQFEAVKILDPHKMTIPAVPAVVVWLDRDEIQQALSHVKFLRMLTGFCGANAAAFAQSLLDERANALAKFEGIPQLRLRFEDAITNPCLFTEDIAEFLAPHGYALSASTMAACVRRRRNGANCEPGLDIEMELVRERERQTA